MAQTKTFISAVSKKEFPLREKVSAATIRLKMFEYIQTKYPSFNHDSVLSVAELNLFREEYISFSLNKEFGELTQLEKNVLASMQEETILTEKLDNDNLSGRTIGQRLADKVAAFGGSWKFIISFGTFLVIWIFSNVYFLSNKGFDPYPFILLNLILSCIAAMQAPVIMMSQNRQEEKDRDRAKKDYMINLKSELEIRILHEKLDHLIQHQQQELMEIQKIQTEMLNDLLTEIQKNKL